MGYRFTPASLATLATLRRMHPEETRTSIVERALAELLQHEQERGLVPFPGGPGGSGDSPPAAG